MFGHDSQDDNQDDSVVEPAEPVADASLGDGGNDATQPVASDNTDNNEPDTELPGSSIGSFAPSAPPPSSEDSDDQADQASSPAVAAPGADDLLAIKQEALQSLSPLLGHLDQTPEEKFRTTMMMIQASDNQSLIQTAYEAAKDIKDEKVKAQALLDIVNEINYFTQQPKD